MRCSYFTIVGFAQQMFLSVFLRCFQEPKKAQNLGSHGATPFAHFQTLKWCLKIGCLRFSTQMAMTCIRIVSLIFSTPKTARCSKPSSQADPENHGQCAEGKVSGQHQKGHCNDALNQRCHPHLKTGCKKRPAEVQLGMNRPEDAK